MRWFRCLFRVGGPCLLVLGLLGGGCNCEEVDLGRNNPTSIAFIRPAGSLIMEGTVEVRVKDADGISRVVFSVAGKKIASKDGEGKNDGRFVATFDLAPLPDRFVIRIETRDMREEKAKKESTFHKDTGAPVLKFLEPTKIKDTHRVVFVGKKFKMAAEGVDPDGISEIKLYIAPESGAEVMKRQCAGSETPNHRDVCETEVDASGAKEGILRLLAGARDTKGHDTTPKAEMKVILDKTGPQIKILIPADGQHLTGLQEFRAQVEDQAGIKEVKFFVGNTQLQNVTKDAKVDTQYVTAGSVNNLGAGQQTFKVMAVDLLGNESETTINLRLGCQSDADCAHKPGTRCCLDGPTEQKGTCYPTQSEEGGLCNPCTQPCGKGSDGKLMGCVPGACGRKPYRCRKACDLGNANKRPDPCRPADPSSGRPSEYCATSDISKINPSLGACAVGDNCDPFQQKECAPGAQPPYNNCCPAGYGCFPADDDANICIKQGDKGLGDQNCTWKDCTGGHNCKKGLLCTVTVDAKGQPQGLPTCSKMCECDARCRQMAKLGLPSSSPQCSGGYCIPVMLTNGKVPLPVGACTN